MFVVVRGSLWEKLSAFTKGDLRSRPHQGAAETKRAVITNNWALDEGAGAGRAAVYAPLSCF